MTRFFPGPLPDHARNILRRLGYGEQQNREGQVSFNRRFTNAPYPKYHAYVEDRNGGLQVNLHVDQKAATYESAHAHSGEYDGPLLARELDRIGAFVESIKSQADAGTDENGAAVAPKRGGFWGGLFGS